MPHAVRPLRSWLIFDVGQRMSTADQIARHRTQFAALSDDQLLAITWEKAADPPMAIAAKQELAAREAARREKADQERHRLIEGRLSELKMPHWSVAPNFWMTLVILILTAIGATAAVIALFR